MTSLSIPQELIHSALEYLSEDIESLSQCALVGQSWLYPAQSCIFRTISLGVGLQDGLALGLVDMPPLGPTINLYPLFHNLLVNSPHLACHIRTLHLGLRPLQSEIDASITALSADDWAEIEECIETTHPEHRASHLIIHNPPPALSLSLPIPPPPPPRTAHATASLGSAVRHGEDGEGEETPLTSLLGVRVADDGR
ncbi:hypothetical protein B0H13DRAFT_2309537 [Mycena leptocephala]|nr:hypothetical protein B0H13DRAFT_2309537 [Mycena leptocephala]